MDKATELAYAEIHSLEMKLLETRDALRGLMRLIEHSHGSSVEEYRAAEKVFER